MILGIDSFAEADLRKVRNRSGFLAGIMRKHGSASTTAAELTSSASTSEAPPLPPAVGTVTTPVAVAVVVDGRVAAVAAVPAPTPPTETAVEGELSETVAKGTPSDAGATTAASVSDSAPGDKGKEGLQVSVGDEEEAAAEEERVADADQATTADGDPLPTVQENDETDGDVEDDGTEIGGDVADGDGEEPLSRRGQKRREEEEVRKLLEEEGGEDLDGDGEAGASGEGASELDRLTGKPRDEDVLLFAVPVCGPYMSLRDYRYKASGFFVCDGRVRVLS